MKQQSFAIPILLAALTTSAVISAQKSSSPAQWRTLLEKAVFARAYEGNPRATKRLFAVALAAAKASGDASALSEVLREQANVSPQQDPRAEQVIGRLLQSITATPLAERKEKISNIDWEFYQRDPTTVRSIAKCTRGKVTIGRIVISLRIEDILDISEQFSASQQHPILRAAIQNEDPYVRSMAVRYCRFEEHLPLVILGLADKNQLVREAACVQLPEETTPEIRAALLNALDQKTAGALRSTLNIPEFLSRMQKADHQSWLAKTMVDQMNDFRIEEWDANSIAKLSILIDWAKASGKTAHAARLICYSSDWLYGTEPINYPHTLARQCIDLALANADQLKTSGDSTAGSIISLLGTIDDLVRLAPLWLLDKQRKDDFLGLIQLCHNASKDDTEKMITTGVNLAKLLVDRKVTESSAMLFQSYWSSLGRHAWSRAGIPHLKTAFKALAAMPENLRASAYPQFVLGVRSSPRNKNLMAVMEQHYVAVVMQRLVPRNAGVRVADQLIGYGSKHAVEVAIALRGQWDLSQQREHYGDFLRRACRSAGDRGKNAVVAAVRSGYTKRPKIVVGKQAARAKSPIQTVLNPARGNNGSGSDLAMPPAHKVVTTKRDIIAELPSLLNVLPPDQAAAAVEELWSENSPMISRKEMVNALLFSRSSRHALKVLVDRFDEIPGTRSKAEVVTVFGELLHTKARPQIARCLDSDEPVLRHAALRAAELLLAYERAKAGMAKDDRRK